MGRWYGKSGRTQKLKQGTTGKVDEESQEGGRPRKTCEKEVVEGGRELGLSNWKRAAVDKIRTRF